MNAWTWLAAALATALSAALLVRVAPRIGWLDQATPETAHRKLQVRPLAPIGGAAILVGMLTLVALGVRDARLTIDLSAPLQPGLAWSVWPAAALALALGAVDDFREHGLDWRAKLLGQGIVAFVLVEPLIEAGDFESATLFFFVTVIAQNAWNTFDNADGVATSVGAVALAPFAPSLTAVLLGFLPFNLKLGRARGRACLGDAGSHLIGVLIVAHPPAWPALVLPLVDLARLSVVRWRAGSRPWIGDRRHLAHRLQRAGLGPLQVALLLVAIATPSTLLGWSAGGVLWTLMLYGCALAATHTAAVPSVATRQ